ncbi:hypothetical protein SSS_05757 [Sarcoptes scabiei]|uniref:Uncharacterized protein n=1 Tax=Sarcoptes scabiei TaxID=52283 RepID=A0A834R667_SARSC|nr:hypothetical protein SSS_05757 [Sarcoptes scabiei]
MLSRNMVEVRKQGRNIPVHVSKIKLYSMMLILSLTTIMAEKISIMKNEPILWKRTSYHVVEHKNYNIIRLLLVSPCEILKQQNRTRTYIEICEDEYRQQIKQGRQLCDRRIRKQRALGFLGTFTTIIIAQSIMGITNLIFNKFSTTEKFESLRTEQLKFEKQMQEINWKTRAIMKDLVRDEEKFKEFVEKRLEDALNGERFIAELAVRGRTMERFFQESRYGKVNPDFHFLFPNLLNETAGNTDQWEFVRCKFEEISDSYTQLEMEIVTPEVSSNLIIWKAVPFNIYKPNKNKYCRYQYSGPRLVCQDHNINCLRKIDTSSSELQIYLNDVDEECMSVSTERMWKLERCDYSKPKSQIKYDEKNAYIYCLGTTLEFPYFNITCENFVYRIPKNTSFSTNGSNIEWSFQERVIEKIQQSYASNSSRINHHLFQNHTDYNLEFKELDKLLQETESSILSFQHGTYHAYWIILITLIILGILVSVFLIFKIASKTSRTETPIMLHDTIGHRTSLRARGGYPRPGTNLKKGDVTASSHPPQVVGRSR